MEEKDDIQILARRAKLGDINSFGRLYDVLVDRLYRYVYFRVGSKSEAEDLTEEIFLKIWEGLKRYNEEEKVPFEAWVFRIARNRVIDYYRTKRHATSIDEAFEIEDDDPLPDEEVERNLTMEDVLRGIRMLRDSYQEIIILKFIEDKENQEISRIINKPVEHVRVLQSRAIKALKKILDT